MLHSIGLTATRMRHQSAVEHVGGRLVAAAVHRLHALLRDVSPDHGALAPRVHAAERREVVLEQPEPHEAAATRSAGLLDS